MAWHVITTNRVENMPRGGARAASTKFTTEMEEALGEYLNDNCTYTLSQMKGMLAFDFSADVSTSTISRRLINKLYTTKQVRTEPATCNNDINKAKRKVFAEALFLHEQAGDYIVFYDETNFNLYCKIKQGRAKQGDRTTLLLPPFKGLNLQMQCAVSVSDGVLLHRLERGSIRMEQNVDYCEAVCQAVKQSAGYNTHYRDKKIVITLDNAPAHQQTEKRIPFHDDAVILRLGAYSPMCNPIEGCFSVLKGEIKAFLGLRGDEMATMCSGFTTMTEQRMTLLERAAEHSMSCITPHLVMREYGHALRAVEAARRLEDMEYGS